MSSSPDLEALIRRAIVLYNRFRHPEAFVKLVRFSPVSVTLEFSGAMCYSCGVLDYIEDFVYEFKILSDAFELKVDRSRETSPRTFEADYKVIAKA